MRRERSSRTAWLEAVDLGDGSTLLDATLCSWTRESGNYTHDAQSVPIVTAGGASGALRTGNYCDYRNLAKVFTRPRSSRPRRSGSG